MIIVSYINKKKDELFKDSKSALEIRNKENKIYGVFVSVIADRYITWYLQRKEIKNLETSLLKFTRKERKYSSIN